MCCLKKWMSALLCGVLILSLCACKKKSSALTDVRKVNADDPYFEASVTELTLPLDPDLIFDSLDFTAVEILGEQILATYYLNYEIPSGTDAALLSSGDLDKYLRHGIARFDLSGNYLGEFPFTEPNRDVMAYSETPDGNICILSSLYSEYSTYIYATTMDQDGNTVKETSLKMPNTGIDPCYSYLEVLSDGLLAVSEGNGFHVFDADGNYLCLILDHGRKIHPEIYSHDGKYYVISSLINQEESSVLLKEVDIRTGSLGEGIDASVLLHANFPEMAEDGAYVTHGNGISRFDIGSGKLEEIFDWNQTDLPRTLVENAHCFPKSEEAIYAISWRDRTEKDQQWARTFYVLSMKKAPVNPHAGKPILLAGGLDLSDAFYEYVYAYNSNIQNRSRLEVLDYSARYAMDEEQSKKTTAEEALTLDILSGKGPDILVDLSGNERFYTENVMVDLLPYMNGEAGSMPLDRNMYFNSVFQAEETDGKLYAIPVAFSLSGLLVNTDLVSEDQVASYDGFLENALNISSDVQYLQSTLQGTLLSELTTANLSSLVNESEHKAHFEDESFRKILQIAKTCGVQTMPSGEADLSSRSSSRDKYMAGICAMLRVDIRTLEDYCLYMSLLPGKSKMIGYPCDDGKGSGLLITCEMRLGITSTCGQKEAAWEAICSSLTKEQQETICQNGSFPVQRDACREVLGKEIEENNRIQEKIERIHANVDPMLPMTGSDIDMLCDLSDSASRIRKTDSDLLNIILEESAGFFAGDREAEEVCRVIQDRAETLLKERG